MKVTIINKLIIVSFIFVGIITIIISCNNNSASGNCNNCRAQTETSGNISINVTKNSENDSVRVILYNELYNYSLDTANNLPILKDTFVKSTSFVLYVPVNHNYSVKAIYHSGAKTINSIDGGKFSDQEFTNCTVNCWQQVGDSYDVTLKFK